LEIYKVLLHYFHLEIKAIHLFFDQGESSEEELDKSPKKERE